MLPVIPKPPISPRQKRVALLVAGTVDLLQVVLFPALGVGYLLDDGLDFLAAVALMAVCGFKWQFVLAFLLELTPFVDLFPTWTAVALMLPTEAPVGGVGGKVTAGPGASGGQEGGAASRGPVEIEAVVVPPVRKREGSEGR